MRFIADCMLGKLTRWLRMLGHDVIYYRDADDEKLIKEAKQEKRVLLTRDVSLYQKTLTRKLDTFFIEITDNTKNLSRLAIHFGLRLEIDLKNSRCPKCNSSLIIVTKNSILDLLPSSSAKRYENYRRCTNCDQIYWEGSHWKRINKTLQNAKQELYNSTKLT
jgi:uncharacterized protein with PIN domain